MFGKYLVFFVAVVCLGVTFAWPLNPCLDEEGESMFSNHFILKCIMVFRKLPTPRDHVLRC